MSLSPLEVQLLEDWLHNMSWSRVSLVLFDRPSNRPVGRARRLLGVTDMSLLSVMFSSRRDCKREKAPGAMELLKNLLLVMYSAVRAVVVSNVSSLRPYRGTEKEFNVRVSDTMSERAQSLGN